MYYKKVLHLFVFFYVCITSVLLVPDLDQGSFSIVTVGSHNGVRYVFKKPIEGMPSRSLGLSLELSPDSSKNHIKNEYDMLVHVGDHPFIVRICKELSHRSISLVVTEFLQDRDLFYAINKMPSESITEEWAGKIFVQIILALFHIHSRGVIHRDIKCENIFVEGDRIVVGDFGLAVLNNSEQKEYAGTPAYCSPEMLALIAYTSKADMWSAGVILYALLCKRLPYYSDSLDRCKRK